MCGKSEIIQLLFVIFTLMIAFSYAEPPSATKVYRRDYQYSRKAKAFYKLHINVEMKGRNAGTICKAEGASLLESTTDKDIEQIHGMMKKYPDIPYVWVGRDGSKYEPADDPYGDSPFYAQLGRGPECTVLKRNGEKAAYSCYANAPFICKVQEKMAPYSEECGTYGPGYVYRASLGSCYNIPRISYPWNQAYVECEAQGAHLVVLNSEVEYHVVWNLIKASPRLQDSQAWFFYHAGFRAYKEAPHPREFKTIFNQTLEEAGFNLWSKNEPNNAEGSEYCGSIFRHDGMFNDVDCRDPFAFVCEKEIKP